MKIPAFRVFNDFDININLYELSYWILFFLFLEYGFPVLLDPIGLNNEILGYELDELFEILILFILPLIVIYVGDVLSGFHYLIAFFLYGLLSAPVSLFLAHEVFSDILGILFVWIFIDDLIESQIDNEGDFSDDLEDFSEDYIKKI